MGGKQAKLKSEIVEELVRSTPFTEHEINVWHRSFLKDCPTGQLSLDEFQRIFSTFFTYGDAKPFARFVFRAFDRQGTGMLEFRDFLLTLAVTTRGNVEDRLRWAFNVYDQNGDGFISRGEMIDVIRAIYRMLGTVVKMRDDEMTAELRVERIFEMMDLDGDDLISLDEFTAGVHADTEVMRLLLQMDTIGLTQLPSTIISENNNNQSDEPIVEETRKGKFSV